MGTLAFPPFFCFIRQRTQKRLECDCLTRCVVILTPFLQRDFTRKSHLLETPKGLMLCNQAFVSVRRKTKTKTISNPLKAEKQNTFQRISTWWKPLIAYIFPVFRNKTLSPDLSVLLFLPQSPGAEDVRNGDAAPGGAGDAEAGEGEPAGPGGEPERGHQGAGSPVEPRHRKQHSPAETTAGDDGHGP